MEQYITPAQAAWLLYLGGAALVALSLYRAVERLAGRDCACTRAWLHELSSTLSAAPGSLGALIFAAALVVAGLLWPAMFPLRAARRWRRRNNPRCGACGRRLTPPRARQR
jgi:hypothetical protein